MPDDVEIGPEWDPGAHDGNIDPELATIMGLTALAALAVTGVGAFFTVAALEAEGALSISYVVGGAQVYAGGTALTEVQAAALAILTTSRMAPIVTAEVAVMLEEVAATWAVSPLSVDALVALAAYNDFNATEYGGPGALGGGPEGWGSPQGFPGGGGFSPGGPPGAQWGCVVVNYEWDCKLYY